MQKTTFLKLNPSIFKEERSDYFEPSYWQDMHAVEGHERGRGTTWFVRHNAHALVLRHYYRGGLISRFNRDRYVFSGLAKTRAIKEYELLKQLFDVGLPVPEPAGARIIRQGRHYSADLITRRINKAQDLLQILQAPASTKLIRDIAACVAQLHNFGVFHPDLNIQNILVDAQQKVWIIDFDQAKAIKLKTRHRMRMLERLERSFMKERARHGIVWTEQNWNVFKEAYNALIDANNQQSKG